MSDFTTNPAVATTAPAPMTVSVHPHTAPAAPLTPAKQAAAVKQAANHALYVRNILSVYYAASAAALIDGARWYATAAQIAADFADRYDVSIAQAVALIALTSPQNGWDRNVALAEKMLAGHRAGLTPLQGGGYLKRALRSCGAVLALDDTPTTMAVSDLVTGQKINAFFWAILGVGSSVCVDGHAFNIALNGTNRVGIPKAPALTAVAYKAVADAYRDAGRVLGVSGTAVQAVTWVTYRALTFTKAARTKRAAN